jgi:hypothetical protein
MRVDVYAGFSLGLPITERRVWIAVLEGKMNDLRQLALFGPWLMLNGGLL